MTEQTKQTQAEIAAEDENHIIAERRAKLAALRAAGVAYPNDFKRTDLFGDLRAKWGDTPKEDLEAAARTMWELYLPEVFTDREWLNPYRLAERMGLKVTFHLLYP